jgi:hypothetical protein
MKTIVYVDGFNLYYGMKRYARQGRSYKWLDVGALCRAELPRDTVTHIHYCTALVQPRPDNPQQDIRQQVYIRALRTIPNLQVHYGRFLTWPTRMPLAHPRAGGPKTVEVIKTEEKGSDVNLATLLLCDGFAGRYELAVIISNDSDLKMSTEVVRRQLKLRVGVLNPGQLISRTLHTAATFYKPIHEAALAASQFPITLTDARGTITKPKSW